MLDLPQDKMEPLPVQRAAACGAVFSFNTEYLGHEQDATGVTVSLRDLKSGREYTQRARCLVGADGAKSKVMDDAGLKLEGQLARAATAYVLFRADLTRYVDHGRSILYWIVTSNAAFGEIGMGLLRAIDALCAISEDSIEQEAGLSAHESKSWLVARSAVPSDRALSCTLRHYQAIPEYIAGFGVMLLKQPH